MRTIKVVIEVDVSDTELLALLGLGSAVEAAPVNAPVETVVETATEEPNQFKCPYCDYTGKSQNSVNSHFLRSASSARPCCPACAEAAIAPSRKLAPLTFCAIARPAVTGAAASSAGALHSYRALSGSHPVATSSTARS